MKKIITCLLTLSMMFMVSAKYCYITHELRLHQNDRCKVNGRIRVPFYSLQVMP